MKLLIKNGKIITGDKSFTADILSDNGKIIEIGKNLSAKKIDKLIDATGHLIFPGGIEPHVHMHLPTPAGYSADDFYTGSIAALHGGTTTLIDFVTPRKGQSLISALNERKKEAEDSVIDYSFHVSPVEWTSNTEEEIKTCIRKEGITSFKVYMAYKKTIGLNDEDIFKVMKVVGKNGGIVTMHCELGDEIEKIRDSFAKERKLTPWYHPLSRPAKMEAKAVKKAIKMAKKAKCPLYIVHVSSKKSIKYIKNAQKKGLKIFAESCPQYLLLDDSKYTGSFKKTAPFVMSPPLRKPVDIKALWKAIAGGIIQTIGTDHCSFTLKQKETGLLDFRKIPNGAGGVEHRMALLYTYGVLKDKISLKQFVNITSTNAAKIFGLYPKKGAIAIGSDSDIIIWNPAKESTISVKSHHQNCDNNIYEGFNTKGAPSYVITKREIAIENGKMIKKSRGKFLERRINP